MRILISLLLLLATPAASSQMTGANSNAGEIIRALERAWNQAEAHKDIKALESLLDSSLVYIDYDGTIMNKAGFIASVKETSLHPQQIVDESTTVHLYHESAVVTGVYRERGVRSGKSYLRHGRFTDTWVHQNGSWTCVASQSTLVAH